MTLDERHLNIRKTARTGTCCAKCARQLEPSEPVWRVRVSFGLGFFGRWSCGVAPFCEACSKPEHKRSLARPCEGCGRPVHHVPSWLRPYAPPPRDALCSHACKGRQQSATARQRRAEARGATRVCACCGEHFEPARADARYCSTACRMRAYRRRVTDAKCLGAQTFDQRSNLPRAEDSKSGKAATGIPDTRNAASREREASRP
jgi:hypothetical protein